LSRQIVILNLWYILFDIYLLRAPMKTYTGKIFMNGRSQAVRLPKEMRFDCNEVYLCKDGENIIISPRPASWDDFFRQDPVFDTTFMENREDSKPQERENN